MDYEERLYAAGKIPGGFLRREGRPSEAAILTCRLTDRPIRPLFPKGFRNDVQVIVTALSADQENEPDILAIIGASAALTISDIPFDGPVAAVRVGYIDGQFVLNPTGLADGQSSRLDLNVAGTARRRRDGRGGADSGLRGASCWRRCAWPTSRSSSSWPCRSRCRPRSASPSASFELFDAGRRGRAPRWAPSWPTSCRRRSDIADKAERETPHAMS